MARRPRIAQSPGPGLRGARHLPADRADDRDAREQNIRRLVVPIIGPLHGRRRLASRLESVAFSDRTDLAAAAAEPVRDDVAFAVPDPRNGRTASVLSCLRPVPFFRSNRPLAVPASVP